MYQNTNILSWTLKPLASKSISRRQYLCNWQFHCAKKPVTTMLTYPWKCTVLHCNHLGNTWKPLVLMTWHFDYCPSASEGDNQSVRSSTPVVFRCFPGGYNVKLYISRGRLAWSLLGFCAVLVTNHFCGYPSSLPAIMITFRCKKLLGSNSFFWTAKF